MKEIRFFDSKLDLTLIADDIISASVSSQWQSDGALTAVFPLSIRYEEMIVPGAFALAAGESFVIESIERDRVRGTLTVRGSSLTSLLKAGVITSLESVKDTPENIVARLIAGAADFPFPFTLKESGAAESIQYLADYGSLDKAVATLTKATDTSCSFILDPKGGKCELYVSSVKDRTASSSDPVTVSDEAGELYACSALTDMSDYYNRAELVGAEKSGASRYKVTLNAAECNFEDGFDDSAALTRTLYVDCTGIRLAQYISGDAESAETELPIYYGAMKRYGRAILSSHRPKRELTGILPGEWEELISVGDKIDLGCARFGIYSQAVIKNKCVNTDGEGTSVSITLSI